MRSPALVVVTSITRPGPVDCFDDGGGHRSAPAHQNEHGRRKRVLNDRDQPWRVGRHETSRLPDDDDPAVHEEGGREAGVHHGAHAELLARSPTDLFDDERVVLVSHHLGQQRPDLLGHQGGVVTLDQVGGHHRLGAHGLVLTGPR